MNKFGRRFVVYGPAASGKTTLSDQISRRVGVPHIEMDALYWLPGWREKPIEEFRTDVSLALNNCVDGWVFDGNYSKARDLILPLADTVVWLRPPFRVAFWRLLKRTIARSRDGKLLWGVNRESWRQAFFSRNSLLLYQVTHWQKYERIGRNLESIPHKAPVIQLRSNKQIEAFLRLLG